MNHKCPVLLNMMGPANLIAEIADSSSVGEVLVMVKVEYSLSSQN